jgi:hypothetical protein
MPDRTWWYLAGAGLLAERILFMVSIGVVLHLMLCVLLGAVLQDAAEKRADAARKRKQRAKCRPGAWHEKFEGGEQGLNISVACR